MQVVSIEDLRDEPLHSLWNLHIQPPAFDAIRAILAWVWKPCDSTTLVWRVDNSLYILWALVYGLTGLVVFWWLSEMSSTKFAVVCALLFLVHPASIFYATFLDTTLLSAFLILCFYHLLWRVKENRYVSGVILAVFFLSLFFVRSIFQWPWVLLVGICLVLMRFPLRRLAVFIVISGVVVGFYTVKQYLQFHLASTSSFTGLNLCNSIGHRVDYFDYALRFPHDGAAGSGKPKVLTRIRKFTGGVNFNNEYYLAVNHELMQLYRRQLLSTPVLQLAKSYLYNLKIYFRPSSRYADNVIVDRLPWRSVYDYVFSFPVLAVLLVAGVILWLLRENRGAYSGTAGFVLPAVSIAFLSIVFEQGENMRFKFFLEPVLFVFLCLQCHNAGKLIRTKGNIGAKVLVLLVMCLILAALFYSQNVDWETLNEQVVLLQHHGQYDKAISAAKRALSIAEADRGPNHLDVASSLSNLAALYYSQGQYAAAEPLYRRSAAIMEKVLGPENPDVVSSLEDLAEVYCMQGRYAAAEPVYNRSLAILEKTVGWDHPRVAMLLNDLAELYGMQGRYAEAEPLYKQSLAIAEKTLSPNHPNVGYLLNNLGELYRAQGRYAEAEALYNRSLAILEKTIGPEHVSVALLLNNLGELYCVQGQYAAAEPLYKRSLAIREKVLGPAHPSVAVSLKNLSVLYEATGRKKDAERCAERAARIKATG